MYNIKISYRTGDSFRSEDCERELEGTWKDLNIVAENLQRIKDHYDWYEEEHDSYLRNAKKKFTKPSYTSDEYDAALNLKLDDGTEYQIYAYWCGYFETLYSASVELAMGFKR